MGSYQCTPGPGAGLVYFFVQIYSTTRIFTLITVILSLVSFDDMAHYNCEVRMIRICFICGGDLIGRDPKVKTVFLFVSKPSDALNSSENNVWQSCFLWSLVLWVSSHRLCFSFDRASYVRPVPPIRFISPWIKHSRALASLAIWNKKKIIMAIAVGAWAISVIFQIQGNFLPYVEV